MLNLEYNFIYNDYLIILFFILLIYIGWQIRKTYKKFIFFLYKRRGKISEKKAINLLKKKGYKIEKVQPTALGHLLQDNIKISFSSKPDLIVSKDNTIFIAEVKSGKAAYIEEINTRRQLLEYSRVFNSNNLILVNTSKNEIKKIEF